MKRSNRHRATLLALLLPIGLAAQQAVRPPLDFSQPIPRAGSEVEIPEEVLQDALMRYNRAGLRATGKFTSSNAIHGSVGLYLGPALLGGEITGDVVMINGDLRLASDARVSGRVIILGGHLTLDPGALVTDTTIWALTVPVEQRSDLSLRIRSAERSLTEFTTTSWSNGSVGVSGRFSLMPYNRVEQLPLRVSTSAAWQPGETYSFQVDLSGTARTITVPDMRPRGFGWTAGGSLNSRLPLPLTLRVDGRNQLAAMWDQPFPGSEPGLNALLFRRDRRDWYWDRSWGVRASIAPISALVVSGELRYSKENSVRENDAFSVFRTIEPWRSNPAADDGRYRTASLGLTWDSRDDQRAPTSGLYLRAELQHITSNSLVPVALPATIRDPIPTSDYSSNQLDLDARIYHRLNPSRSIHLRMAVGGWLSGDPLTLQRRRAVGGAEPLAGYSYRSINCDTRRLPEPATPALCDRQGIFQVEFRQALPYNLTTRLGKREVGFRHPDLVFAFDAASAWLAGPGEGRVPGMRLQALGEWRSSAAIGIDAGNLGVYLAKALADPEPLRFYLQFRPRF